MAAHAFEHDDDKLTPFTDKYDIQRVIGRGGMGTVFEGRHTRLGQRVAIKVLAEELRRHPELVCRFEREARAASALSSPHAVRVFDIDQTADGTPFFVMELLSGRDLDDIVMNEGPQPVGVAVRWIIEAGGAIAEAHRLGIVHRDLKPSNLLLCDNGSIKVLDFGIAKQSAPNARAITLAVQPLGTPQYMSPEQVRCAKDVDVRTDIWSLGVSLYELVTGRPPFDHELAAACIASIAADPVPDPRTLAPHLPEGFVRVLMRALEKDPEARYQTVDELVLALAPYREDVPSEAPSSRVISTMRKAFAKHDATLDGALVDETVPPTLAPAAIPMERHGLRSALVVAGAALVGLAALALLSRGPTGAPDKAATLASAPPEPAVASAAAPPPPLPSELGGLSVREFPTDEVPPPAPPPPALRPSRPLGRPSSIPRRPAGSPVGSFQIY